MTAEEYLMSYRDLALKIRMLEDAIEEVRAMLGIKGISYQSDGTTNTSKNAYKRDMGLAKLATYTIQLEKAKEDLIKQRGQITAFIDQLQDADEKAVLYARYIKRMKYEDIATELNFSVAHIYRLRRDALEKLGEIKSEETK